jgi:hypothetical protein
MWTMVKFMHHEMTKAIMVTMEVVRCAPLSCNDVFIVGNQSWLSIHYYVVGRCKLWWLTFVMKLCFFHGYL